MREVVMVAGLAVLAGFPRVAAAQSPEAPLPPIVSPSPPALDPRPMRFLLSTGAVVIGTRIGENAEAMGVQTRTGIVTLRKTDIVAMDYRIERGRNFDLRSQPVPLARPAPPTPEPPPEEPRPRRHPGRGATIAGAIVFSLAYGVSCLAALISVSASDDDTGAFLALPIAGPIIWGLHDRDDVTTGLLLTATQTVGAALLAFGIMGAHEADEDGPYRRAFGVAPVLTAEVRGLVVAGSL